MDRIEEGKDHVRSVSDVASIWMRASSVPEADPTPKQLAEWSVFYVLAGFIVIFQLVKWYRNKMYNTAISDLKKKSREEEEKR